MTASLPMPGESNTPQRGERGVGARDSGEIITFPPKPPLPDDLAASAHPGPPPPLPEDLVAPARPTAPSADADLIIPPRPPLPAGAADEDAADADGADEPAEDAPDEAAVADGSDDVLDGGLPGDADDSEDVDLAEVDDEFSDAVDEHRLVDDDTDDAEVVLQDDELDEEDVDEAPLDEDALVANAPDAEDVVVDEAPDAEDVAVDDALVAEEAVETDAPDDLDDEESGSEYDVDAEADAEPVSDIVSLVLADEEPAADAALSLRGVTKVFGQTPAVDGIDLTVPAGTFYGLVGPNGAGKTTTLSMIAGLLRPDKGAISVTGIDAIADPVAAKRLMGVLPDRLRTFDRLTGRQLLYYYGVLRGLSPSVVESRTADLARAFDLTDALGRVVSDYSVGMTKKVMLAGALIHSPRVLVLDEPFESVDPVSSAVILDILATYVDHGGTVILSSHGMELVERVCSRVAVIVAGQVLAEGTIDEVRGELTLEQRFVELAGGLSDVEGLEWLHTFSD